MVELVDDDDAREIDVGGVAPDAVGGGFETVLGVDDDKGGFNGEHGGAGFVEEHVEAGGVDEVDFYAVPFGEGDGVRHGGAAADLFFVVGGDGGAIFHPATVGRHFSGVQQDGDQGCLAAVGMSHDSYVANILPQIGLHVALPFSFRADSSCGSNATPLILVLWKSVQFAVLAVCCSAGAHRFRARTRPAF